MQELERQLVGVQPLGACFQAGCKNVRNAGLGKLASFSDEHVLSVLACLGAKDLIRLSSVSKALYCFANHEELWKAVIIQEFEGRFTFQATWKDTFVHMLLHHPPTAPPEPSPSLPTASCATQLPSSCNLEHPEQSHPASKRQRVGTTTITSCASAAASHNSASPRQEKRLKIAHFYSDMLYQSHLCATREIDSRWLEGDNLPRVHAETLTRASFIEYYEKPNVPVVLTGCKEFALASKKWDYEYLRETLKGRDIIAGDMEMQAEDFFTYLQRQNDDSPLYLFDQHFADRSPSLAQDYCTPSVFPQPTSDNIDRDLTAFPEASDACHGVHVKNACGNADGIVISAAEQEQEMDLFALLGDSRPSFRWLILGGKRSGSTFHVDPNGTSAWNACICGKKLWVMFPPGPPPPGVHVSEDGASVATPVCPMEWFLSFYEECCELYGQPEDTCTTREHIHSSSGMKNCSATVNSDTEQRHQCNEDARPGSSSSCEGRESGYKQAHWKRPRWYHGVVSPGEVMFVPRGWWHCVLNLDSFGAAITQNFVSPCNLPAVLRVLQSRNLDLISGCPENVRPKLYDMFTDALRLQHPSLLAVWEQANECGSGMHGKALSKMFCDAGTVERTVDESMRIGGGAFGSDQGDGWLCSVGQAGSSKEVERSSHQFSFKFSIGPE